MQRKRHVRYLLVLGFVFLVCPGARRFVAQEANHQLPEHIPPKRSSQIIDGFGINSDLPRDPYLP